jgi:hypothetical protein
MKRQKQRYRVSLLRRQFDITALLNEHLPIVQQLHEQVQTALNRGVKKEIAYSLPRPELFMLLRYERAIELYEEYKRNIGTPRADRIIIPALPSTKGHVLHFFCASTSDKDHHAYTHYRVVLARHKGELRLFCSCPDFSNRRVTCKHIYLTQLYLRDRAVVEKR